MSYFENIFSKIIFKILIIINSILSHQSLMLSLLNSMFGLVLRKSQPIILGFES